MMRSFLIGTLLFFSFSAPASALLPPLYQEIQEIDAILHSEELPKNLPKGDADIIREIIKKSDNSYLIKTDTISLIAEVIHHQKKGIIGPGIVEVKFKKNTE